jgi:membrane protease YdiL (CAAX protease family)
MELHSSRTTVLFVILLFALWTTAWLIHNLLAHTAWLAVGSSKNHDLIYWASMKVLIWVVFPVSYAKTIMRVEELKTFLAIRNAGRGIVFGIVAGTIWIAASYIFQGHFRFHFVWSFTLLWLLTGTPICEEFTFRGVILGGLQRSGMEFWPANTITALLFLLIHFVGWTFQGAFIHNFSLLVTGSIVLLGLANGWLRFRSNSLYSCFILHSLNNLCASIS